MALESIDIVKQRLERIAGGDETAFNELFQLYQPKLFQYLCGVTKSPEIAEELVIDIFVKLWVGRELLPNVIYVEPFLHKVAYNKAMDFFREISRRKRLQEAYFNEPADNIEKPVDQVLIDAESRAIIRDAVNQLPPQRRKIYRMSREEGLTHDEIAAVLQLSTSTVKNAISLSSKTIFQYLKGRHQGDVKAILLLFLLS